jgi:hypothetical protein
LLIKINSINISVPIEVKYLRKSLLIKMNSIKISVPIEVKYLRKSLLIKMNSIKISDLVLSLFSFRLATEHYNGHYLVCY